MRPNPPGFNPSEVIAGLHTAMAFGAPNKAADRATFYWVEHPEITDADEAGVPFSPDARPARTVRSLAVPCAIDFTDGADRTERFGVLTPSRIEITLLDPDYQRVKEFEYVVWGGDKYLRRETTPGALGSLDVWTVRCRAEDDR